MPSKNDINPATGKPYAVNPATGVWDDNYWANVVEPMFRSGGGDIGGGGGADSLINSSIQAYSDMINNYNKRFTEYTQQNPFNFDTVLQEEQAKVKQRLDPYYNQTLGDYLQGINLQKSRSLEDERTILSQLQTKADQYQGEQKAALSDALEEAGNGYASRGLYESGARQRAEGKLEADSNAAAEAYNTNKANTEFGIQRDTQRYVGEDLPLAEAMKRRALTQEQTYNVQAQAIPQAQQRQSQYEFGRQQYAGNLPGVNPLGFQNSLYSNFLGA